MSTEHDEFAQMVQAALASEQNANQTTTPPAPAPEKQQEAAPEGSKPTADSGDAEVKAPVVDETKKPDEKTVETKPEDKPEEKKTDWKAAAERERQKRQQKAAQKAQESQLATEVSQLKQQLAKFQAIEAKKQTDLLGAAAEAGFDYDLLTKEYLRSIDKQPDAVASPQSAEIKQLIQKIQQLESAFHDQRKTIAQQQEVKAVQEFYGSVKSVIEAKGDEFELLKVAEEGPELVRAIVAAKWNETAKYDSQGNLIEAGEMMPTEEACKLAEEYFETQQLKRFAQTKKFLAFAKPAEKPKEVEKPQPSATTLSNSMRQGGGDHVPTFGSETEELMSMIKRLEAQQGN